MQLTTVLTTLMPNKTQSIHWMRQALEQAQQAIYLSDPNPRVGCVLVDAQNHCIGRGYTQAVGSPHAEIMALRDAQAKGHAVQGSTAYVTLEPCSHHGRTPPCADALIAAGVARVVIAATDPNPLVAGQGIERLRAAGIQVETDVLAHDSEELNIGFFSRMQRQRPWVRLKMACSLDGKTALPSGESQWITGSMARADGHHWRARASAILTGVGTILADNPQLNVRSCETPRQPWHAIVDTHLQMPPNAMLFQTSPQVVIYTASTDTARQQALQQVGATICAAPLSADDHIDLPWVLHDLAQRECNELHVEAGSTLSSALLKAGLADELLVYMAPRLMGEGKNFITGFQADTLAHTMNFTFTQVEVLGEDIRLMARRYPANVRRS
ncbi:bifunctional diaminohydroxyphosphoribosylaminopyrimidine deaminase/5-amino-6-(5-phosphoribosylamino)uracil reductase RibD [Saezia sanguinis]|uniref:bifunctional diaminohydroxyphosphoribosylaminopyrimidine deaminase/5-amino-6-(5-phosphoribosylamino)uracil reductase RibD n=1 Tax=Saezia sanguinis TaxID=1965230 RepID=UPI0030520C66